MNDARSNTAIGTTATAEPCPAYRGRFAPSPSGRLHSGSLLAALGSYLDARHHGGRWLIRIEDLDTPRNQPGLAADILQTLAYLGLESDEAPLYQSARYPAYEHALAQLQTAGLTYPCSCSRSQAGPGVYGGHCRPGPSGPPPYALRLRQDDHSVLPFVDRFAGLQQQAWSQLGDPILRRRDELIAYQLAVVVDDAYQGITDIVRGSDLLASTAWQRAVGQALKFKAPRYAHLPLLLGADGSKLSKSRSAAAIAEQPPATVLVDTLAYLQQAPPADLYRASIRQILDWGIAHWQPERLQGLTTLTEKGPA